MKKAIPTLIVAYLGYFIDIFDVVLFGALRVPSLKAIGIPQEELLSTGLMLFNCQVLGILIGGFFWGKLGDVFGRTKILLFSILCYSLATFFNAFVTNLEVYILLRFLAGFGLAGEGGVAFTLVSELISNKARSYATPVLAAVGALGAGVAGYISTIVDWQTSYIIGGAAGLLLLVLRINLVESTIFEKVHKDVVKGSLKSLIFDKSKSIRFFSTILAGSFFFSGWAIYIGSAPEIAQANGLNDIKIGITLIYYNIGLISGEILIGFLSIYLKSRKKALGIYLTCNLIYLVTFLNLTHTSAQDFYYSYLLIGFFSGYWCLIMTISAEQFGTNIRSSSSNIIQSIIRALPLISSPVYINLKNNFGILNSATYITILFGVFSIVALFGVQESFEKDLNFTE